LLFFCFDLTLTKFRPGESLPDFPPETHAKHPSNGLRKFNSAYGILNQIPRYATLHDVTRTPQREKHKVWDGFGLADTLTCQPEVGYPTRERGLTPREYAALQTFSHRHIFSGTSWDVQYRQIGNAVPPMIAEIFFRHFIKHLKQSDTAEKLALAHR
jgi:DNA (cytosine-5)-methyltransferase 1